MLTRARSFDSRATTQHRLIISFCSKQREGQFSRRARSREGGKKSLGVTITDIEAGKTYSVEEFRKHKSSWLHCIGREIFPRKIDQIFS